MFRKLIVFTVCAASLSFSLSSCKNKDNGTSPKLIEKVSRTGSEMVIPYEKYVLSNGLTLIVHEDHSDPIVHVDVTYHVGSSRETTGRSGFAHFFEHMMFQGSDHVGDDQHFKIVSEAGGTLNGSTNSDRTNYFETVPNNQLEVALWLEADRMGFLLDAVTQQKFEIQRATVKNERGQRIDNKPYGRLGERVDLTMYPEGHPYNWPVIGWLEDLDSANVDDLKNFFLRWYGPNNATLTVAGDINTADVVKLTQKYFGGIHPCPDVKPPVVAPFTLKEDQYNSFEDNVRFPLIEMAYPTVARFNKDEPALDILADILGGGKNSFFYKKFVKSELAVNANVSHPTSELGGAMQLTVYAMTDQKLPNIEKLMREALDDFEKAGVTDDDLTRFKSSNEASILQRMSGVQGKAGMLASYQTFTGNPNYLKKELDEYAHVTKEDVMRVYKTYIKGKAAVIMSVYPKGKVNVAKEDNFHPKPRPNEIPGTTFPKVAAEKIQYVKAKDDFDRSKKPIPGAAVGVKSPVYWTENFANGMKVIGSQNNEVPLVTMSLSVEAGHKNQSSNPSKAGLARLTADLMNESSEKHTAAELSDLLNKIGCSVSFSSDRNYITMRMNAMLKNLGAATEIAEERLMHPAFNEEDFNRVKKQQLEKIANQSNQPVQIADNVFDRLVFGEDNILGINDLGTEKTLNNITLDDVKKYYKEMIDPGISNLVIVGDIDQKTILSKLGFLKNWAHHDVKIVEEKPGQPFAKSTIYLVDKPGAPQSEIRVGCASLPFDATGDYYKSTIMNFILGGAFNSRINMNLREDKGWTYGARSSFSGDKTVGSFVVAPAIKADATDSSVVEIMKELKNYVEAGIKDEELTFTKNSLGLSEALKYETPAQKASFLQRIIIYNLEKGFAEKQNEILKNITAADISALAKKYVPYQQMAIVVVGNSKKIKAGLMKLGYDLVELNADGSKK